jgi:hypothetical protein
LSAISFIYIINKRGSRTDPCGSPANISQYVEELFLITTSFNPDKTEIMIFSNRSIPENLDFSFNGKSVPTTTSHKHSDFSFFNDANWECPCL